MVRLPPVVMSAKSATARTTIAREDAEVNRPGNPGD